VRTLETSRDEPTVSLEAAEEGVMNEHAAALDAACLVAHGEAPTPVEPKTLVVGFYNAVAHELLLMGARLGYAIALLDPDDARRDQAVDRVPSLVAAPAVDALPAFDENTDAVFADHHRDELGPLLRDLLATRTRWIGLMGTPRHEGPHIAALRALGVDDADIARVHRPIGLNVGSKTPAEIAIAALAGLIADRAGRPGGFAFASVENRVADDRAAS
jgi:xanthine/CO dehydrogenase XdhC/CoxF family maturation factor